MTCLVTLACVAGKISSLFAVVFGVGAAIKLGAFRKSNCNFTCPILVFTPALACLRDVDGTPL